MKGMQAAMSWLDGPEDILKTEMDRMSKIAEQLALF
jgi:hypothetical protein